MPYCLYVRKSRKDILAESAGEGETLSRHINTLFDLANKRGLPVTKVYKEIVSGETVSARPVMQQLLFDIGSGMWEGVLVMEIERLARGDTLDQGIVSQAFRYSGTKIITPIKDYDPNDPFDEEYFEFGLFMSRREYKTINRRLQAGRLASVNEGKWCGSVAPYGYIKERSEHGKGFMLVPYKPEADCVKLIFGLYTEGERLSDSSQNKLGTSLIAKRLNSLNIKPRKSERWSPATVRDILSNPVYIGKIRWNYRKTEKKIQNGEVTVKRKRKASDSYIETNGVHEAIIDAETFKKAEKQLSERRIPPVPEKYACASALSGLIFCSVCGKKMIKRRHNNKYPDTLICPTSGCRSVSAKYRDVEKSLIQSLQYWLNGYTFDLRDSPGEEIGVSGMVAEYLDGELKRLNKQADLIHELFERGQYSYNEFRERKNTILSLIEANKKSREMLNESINDQECTPHLPEKISFSELYYMLPSPQTKNELLKKVIVKAEYFKSKKGTAKKNDSDRFSLTVYPKLNNIPGITN